MGGSTRLPLGSRAPSRLSRLALVAGWIAAMAGAHPAVAASAPLRTAFPSDPQAAALDPAAVGDPTSATNGARLVRADHDGVSFELSVPDPVFTRAGAPDEDLLEVGMVGFEGVGAMGAPALPERIVWIGVPPGARVEVDGVGLDPVEYGAVRLAPLVPRPELSAEERARGADTPARQPERLLPLLEQAAYREGISRGPVAELATVTGMRAQTVASIRLRPAVYDPGTGTLRVFRRLAVTVRFTGVFLPGVAAPEEPAFEPVYRAVLLNYESARSFRGSFGARLARSLRPTGSAGRAAVTAVDFSVSPAWTKLVVDKKGIQRVGAEDLQAAGVSLAAIVPSQLRVFTRPGVPLLDENSFCDTCGLAEVAIRVVGGDDGRFDPGDYILFYGLPPSGWRDEFTGPGGPSREWLDHPYETRNPYWLTWQATVPDPPRRWASRDASPTQVGAWNAPSYPARLHFEVDAEYWPSLLEPGIFWDQWVWSAFHGDLRTQQITRDAPGAVIDQPARLRARFWGVKNTFHQLDLTFNNVPLARRSWVGALRMDVDSSAVWIKEIGNRFTAKALLGSGDLQALLYWELYFQRRFTAVTDVAEFASPDTTGPVGYGVAPFSAAGTGSVELLDTSDPLGPVELTGWVARDTTGGKAIYFDDDLAGARFYYASTAAAFRKPRVELAAVRDLHAAGLGADYLIITYDGFEPQAQRLAALRSRILPGVSNPSARVVRISDILAWYAGGRMDPTAIRNFLYDISNAASSRRWSLVPSYVVFLGDASYDFKNILGQARAGTPPALVPSYVHGFISAQQFMTDDWLADVDLGPQDPPPPNMINPPDDIPDFFIGRLPASTSGEASVLVDSKIVPYDERPTFGEWRNRALLVADDTWQGFNTTDGTPAPDALWGVHLAQSEQLEKFGLPAEIDRQKLYLVRYPFGVGAEKPLANADTRKWVNEGSLLWNFIGHGNPFKMADENAFIISDVPSLTNLDRLTFAVAASCDVGKFDDANLVGLGEALLKSPVGGAIATYSSSDIAFSSANSSLNIGLLQSIFTPSPDGYAMSLGQASYVVKRRTDATDNDRKYTLQGDPGTRLGSPRYAVRMTLLDDETGAAIGDTLIRGRRVRLEGQVHGTHDTTRVDLRTDFNGTASVLIADSAPLDTFSLYPGAATSYYSYNPGPVFHGDVPVVGGRFTARFWVPMEAVIGPRAKARAYVQSPTVDGVGARTQVVAGGLPAEVDTTGPTVHLQFTRGGTTVSPDAELRIVLEDEHGIDITGHSLPNSIVLTVDEQTRYDLTELFRYDSGSFTRGTLLYRLPGLPPGEHTIEVSAADNFAQGIQGRKNRTRTRLDFTVVSSPQPVLARGFNFPNPFNPERGTRFIFDGLAEAGRVEVSVFTVGGHVVRRLAASGGPGQVQIGWDGRDDTGVMVSNGVYLYRAEIFAPSGGLAQVLEGRAAAVR